MKTPKQRTVKYAFDPGNPPKLTAEQKAELAALAQMRDEDIDFSDQPPLTAAQLARAVRANANYKPVKKATSLRLDGDVIEWLKSSGPGWQTRANTLLRDAMLRER